MNQFEQNSFSVDLLVSSYTTSKEVFGVDPIKADPRKQNKIRRWIQKTYLKGETFPEEIAKHIRKNVSDSDFFAFLNTCHEQIRQNEIWAKQRFEQFSFALPEEVKETLWKIIHGDIYTYGFCIANGEIALCFECSSAMRRCLVFKNASGVPTERVDSLSFQDGSLVKQGDEYCLIGEAENFENDKTTPVSLRFTDIELQTEIYRADACVFHNTPWNHLCQIASDIVDKGSLSGEPYNEKEKSLLPLLTEISKLLYWHNDHSYNLSLFKLQVKQFGYDKVLSLIEQFEKAAHNDKKRCAINRKLIATLNQTTYEPLWRHIYDAIVKSQEEYPTRTDALCSDKQLQQIRTDIQAHMEANGFTGTYPDFVKFGEMRGIHLEDSYDITYFVGFEKHAVYHIHCTEEVFLDGSLMIQFLCGTALLRKDETADDVYSCLFNAKGRRLYHDAEYHADKDEEVKPNDLTLHVNIAAKLAQRIKLTKEERREHIGFDQPYVLLFTLVLLVMGLPFGFFMTLGFMLMAVLAALIVGQPETILTLLTDIPWWAIFLLSWGLFGGLMGIVTIFAKRK